MKQRRSDSTFTSQLFQDASAIEVLDKHVKEANLSMHADLTRLINERSSVPFYLLMTRITLKGYKMASKKTWEQIPLWVEPISERYPQHSKSGRRNIWKPAVIKKQQYKWERKRRKKILLLHTMLNAIALETIIHCVTLALTIASYLHFENITLTQAWDLDHFLKPFVQRKENVCFLVHNQAASWTTFLSQTWLVARAGNFEALMIWKMSMGKNKLRKNLFSKQV